MQTLIEASASPESRALGRSLLPSECFADAGNSLVKVPLDERGGEPQHAIPRASERRRSYRVRESNLDGTTSRRDAYRGPAREAQRRRVPPPRAARFGAASGVEGPGARSRPQGDEHARPPRDALRKEQP